LVTGAPDKNFCREPLFDLRNMLCGISAWPAGSEETNQGRLEMTTDRRLEASLLLMRLAIAAFLLVWAIDKVIAPAHAQAVFSHFYFTAPSPAVLKSIGFAQMAIIVAFAAGFARFWTYGAVLFMHAASTASTYAQLLNPWAGEGPQLLFWAAVPVLAAMTALFVLRDRDRLLSVDAMRSK
jgi:putative oxidoreductase